MIPTLTDVMVRRDFVGQSFKKLVAIKPRTNCVARDQCLFASRWRFRSPRADGRDSVRRSAGREEKGRCAILPVKPLKRLKNNW